MGSLLLAAPVVGLVPAPATMGLQLPGVFKLSIAGCFTNPPTNTEVNVSGDTMPIRFRD